MRFQLPDICVEQFAKCCQEARNSPDHRFILPVKESSNLAQLETLNGKKITSINLACYDISETGKICSGDYTLAWFEIETED